MPPVAAPEAPSVLPTCRTLLRPLVTEEFIWAVEGMTLDRMKVGDEARPEPLARAMAQAMLRLRQPWVLGLLTRSLAICTPA